MKFENAIFQIPDFSKKWRLRQGSSGILPKLPWRSLQNKWGWGWGKTPFLFHRRSSSIKGRFPLKVQAQLAPYVVHYICRDSPNIVHFRCRDSPNLVHFKCRDCPYIVHIKRRGCIYVTSGLVYQLRPASRNMVRQCGSESHNHPPPIHYAWVVFA